MTLPHWLSGDYTNRCHRSVSPARVLTSMTEASAEHDCPIVWCSVFGSTQRTGLGSLSFGR
jgi:hypothetical protein